LRVLLINQYYPPDTSATAKVAASISFALAARNDMTVLPGRPSYAPTEEHGYYLTRSENSDGVAVERVGSTGFDRSSPFGRLANYLTYLLLMPIRVLTLSPRPDVVVVMTDPPVAAIVAAVVSRIMRVPFIYAVQDLHPDMAVAAGISIPRPLADLWDRAHRWALCSAHKVIVLGDDMARRIEAKGVAPANVVVVRTGSVPLPVPETDGSAIRARIRDGFKFVALHAGNLGHSIDFVALADAARRLDPSIGIVMVGAGARRDELQRSAADIPNLRFLDYFPASELRHVMEAGDIHIVSIKPGLEGLVVPSKLYSTLSAARPVLAAAPATSDVAVIVGAEGCGVHVNPTDAGAIADAINELVRDPARLKAMAEASGKASGKYARDRELAKLVELVEMADETGDSAQNRGVN
jgi:colanic acid biosynthesis glycosyl transferase WcaI